MLKSIINSFKDKLTYLSKGSNYINFLDSLEVRTNGFIKLNISYILSIIFILLVFYKKIYLFFLNGLRVFIYTLVVLTNKLNGNETMDAITALYTEVIFLCYVIVFIVLDILLSIEKRFSTHYYIPENDFFKTDETLFKNFLENEVKTKFNLIPLKYSLKSEAVMDLAFLLFPTAVIFYIVIPTLGFLYNKDINLESLNSSFSIDIIGHQWY